MQLFNLPNFLTMCNLFLGCCALVFIDGLLLDLAAVCTVGCFVCDYLDGMLARALKINSPIGKELDSLADVVSFGVVPGLIFYKILGHSDVCKDVFICPFQFLGFVLSAFSALRLAKFNLDTRQANYFIGLSTPACTLLVMGLGLSWKQDLMGLKELLRVQPYFLLATEAILCWLLISEIPMFGMKLKGLDLKSILPLLVAVILGMVLFYFLGVLALCVLVVIYILASIVFRQKIVA